MNGRANVRLKILTGLILAFAAFTLTGQPVRAQSVDLMLSECSQTARNFFRDWGARTDMRYNGQRVDGTYAINGRIFLETRFEDFACSYGPGGQRMVEFFAEGRRQNAYLPGGGANRPGAGTGNRPSMAQVTGIAANDVLNVRSEPFAGARIVGALSNGTTVRNLGCQAQGNSNWCRIRMLDEMGGEGWVNARFLNIGGVATQLPESPASQRPVIGETRTVRVRFPGGMNRAELRDAIAPGGSIRYIVNARNGQFLTVRLTGNGLAYQIFNPDNSFLLGQVSAAQKYRGELWQSGNHVIEVINRSNRSRSFNVVLGIN